MSYTAEGPNFTRWHLKLLERPNPFCPDPLLPEENDKLSFDSSWSVLVQPKKEQNIMIDNNAALIVPKVKTLVYIILDT